MTMYRSRVCATARCVGEAGYGGGLEALPFGVLTFVVGTLLVANAWAVVDARGAVDAAAREGARSYVEAADLGTAEETARSVATEAMVGHGRDPTRLELDIVAEGGFGRCARVIVSATYPVPALRVPWVGDVGGPIEVTGHHSELVDPYRDGLEVTRSCD